MSKDTNDKKTEIKFSAVKSVQSKISQEIKSEYPTAGIADSTISKVSFYTTKGYYEYYKPELTEGILYEESLKLVEINIDLINNSPLFKRNDEVINYECGFWDKRMKTTILHRRQVMYMEAFMQQMQP